MKTDDLEYYYNEQLKKLLVQFLAVFVGMKVKSGKTNELDERFIDVQVKGGSSDRVVAAIKNENTQNKPLRLPVIAGSIASVDLAPELRHGTRTERNTTTFPSGGNFPTDLRVNKQSMPIPYNVIFELNIYASSQEQHYEMLEHILMLFDPTLEIYTSDDVLDWARLTKLELVNINIEEGVPGIDRRIIQTTLSFKSPLLLSLPATVRNNYIAEIKMRVGAVNSFYPVEDALLQLDSDGVEYQTIAKLGDISLD